MKINIYMFLCCLYLVRCRAVSWCAHPECIQAVLMCLFESVSVSISFSYIFHEENGVQVLLLFQYLNRIRTDCMYEH